MRNRNKRPALTWWHGVFFLLGLATATALQFAFSGKHQKAQPPWGELEYTTFLLLRPEEVSANRANPESPSAPISTLLMKLRVRPQSDLDALIRYWGQGESGRAMRPFLESLVKVPQGEAVNISYFLPAIARMRLYTFPDARKDQWSVQQDALWTGMNFFKDAPDNSYTNLESVEVKLATDYTQVKTNFVFGDLVVLRNSYHQIRHMCVHIADNVVFTNPASGVRGPWVLMSLTEMLTQVATEKPLEMLVYRKKQT